MWAEVDALVDVLVGDALPLLLVEQVPASSAPPGAGGVCGHHHTQQQQRMSSQHVSNILYAMGRCVQSRMSRCCRCIVFCLGEVRHRPTLKQPKTTA